MNLSSLTNKDVRQRGDLGVMGGRVAGDVVPAVHVDAGCAPAPPNTHCVSSASVAEGAGGEYSTRTYKIIEILQLNSPVHIFLTIIQ